VLISDILCRKQTSRKPSVRRKFQSPVLSNIYVLPDIRSDIYFEIVGPTAFLSVRTDGPTVFGKSAYDTKSLNSVYSFIKMSDRDLKFVYLFCQTDTFLFVIETPIQMYVNVNILLVIVGPTAFLSVRTDGPTVFGKSAYDTKCQKLAHIKIIDLE
jgi:hypothetical protein